MPHALATVRDDLDALIGPLEELQAKLDDIIASARGDAPSLPAEANGIYFVEISNARNSIEELVSAIDEYEEPEIEPEVEEEDDETEADEDEDEDEE